MFEEVEYGIDQFVSKCEDYVSLFMLVLGGREDIFEEILMRPLNVV